MDEGHTLRLQYTTYQCALPDASCRYESTEEFLSALRRKVKPPSWPEISNAPQDSNAVDTTFEVTDHVFVCAL
jgi:hypothetical protein